MNHREFLFKVLDVLDKNNIPYVFFAGTLLGAIRDKGFLPSDIKDTDIVLDEKYYWPVRKLFDSLSNEFKWLGIWRKELSITGPNTNIKVDMFFMEKQDDKYLVYSYKKNNINGAWDYEWRAKFSYDCFFPAINYEFLGRTVSIPNNYEKLLTEEYGDWRTPKPEWVSTDTTVLNTDTEYKGFTSGKINTPGNYISSKSDIAIVTTNICRPDTTKACIESIRKYYPDIKIYILDQDEPCGEMIEFYETNNVQYYYKTGDVGLSYARNYLLEQVTESQFMIIDNDFIFTDETKIEILSEILNQDENIGLVAGKLNGRDDYVKNLVYDKESKKLYYVTIPYYWFYTELSHYKYCYSDLVLNFFLAKKEVWNDCKWDNDLKVAEHTAFFLALKATKWKPVFTPIVTAEHIPHRSNEYKKYRLRGKQFLNLFIKKIGLKSINDIVHISDSSHKINQVDFPLVENINDLNNENNGIEDCIKALLNYTNKFWFLKESCKDIVNNHVLNNQEKIEIGTIDNETALVLEKIGEKYNINIEVVEINSMPRVKPIKLYNLTVSVPCPVVFYLNEVFGPTWKT